MACASRGFARENGDYPVRVNEVINSSRCAYQVLDVLGRGTFGQVLKAWKLDTSQLVALKVLKNIPSYTKQGQLEIDVLTRLSCQAVYEYNIVQAYESFTHCGHICISFELLEINLYDYLKQNRFQPLALKHIRPIAQQVLSCLQRLQELGLVHSDIKPENIMLIDQARWPYRVKVIDFGSATLVSASNATSYLQSRYYRAPEVILSLPYSEAIDMWSLGCVLAELFLGWPLFPGSNEYDQISFIVRTLGKPPNNMFRNIRKACKFFSINHHNNQWTLKTPHQVKSESGIVSKETRKHIFTSLSDLTRVGSHGYVSVVEQLDCLQFVSFLATMLTFVPSSRSSPTRALQYPFITMQHLATHTTDVSVREWIQCMHVCCLSRTTNSSPPTTTVLPTNHSLLPSQPPHIHHHSLPHSMILPQSAYLAPQPPILTCPHPPPQPHPLAYHLSSITYLPQHFNTQKKSSSCLMSEDTGYGSADNSPTSYYVLPHHEHQAHQIQQQQQLILHSSPAHYLTQHQLYSLYNMAQHTHTPSHLPTTATLPPSNTASLAPHHPFSRL